MTTQSAPLDDCPFEDFPPVEPDRSFVERAEPISAGVAFSIPSLASAIPNAQLVGLASIEGVPHPFDGKCKVCQERRDEYFAECERTHTDPSSPPPETKLDVLWRKIDHPLSPGWFAVNCCSECYEEAKKDTAREARNREMWERFCPVEFRKDWDNRLGDPKTRDLVMAFDPDKKRGLIIHGDSGGAKTRAVWKLIQRLAEEGRSFLFIESIDLIEAIPPEAYTVETLIIDDFGQDQMKGVSEVRLLKLLRTRCNWHRPIIITTQFNREKLTEKFTDSGTAKAVLRRLVEFCDAIHAKPGLGSVKPLSRAQMGSNHDNDRN